MTVCVTDQQASAGRTTIIVAHRLSTIQRADVIVVVEDGTIIEMGTQKELLAKQGRFYKLVVAQVYSNVMITLFIAVQLYSDEHHPPVSKYYDDDDETKPLDSQLMVSKASQIIGNYKLEVRQGSCDHVMMSHDGTYRSTQKKVEKCWTSSKHLVGNIY